MTNRLDGKVCLVTGAGSGIGRAIATAFGTQGARVVVNDVDGDAARAVVEEITREGNEAVSDSHAIGTVRAAEALLGTALDSYGEVDVLVNNAGVLRDRMIHNMSEQEWDQVIEVHLKGAWACARALVQYWRPLAKAEAENGEAKPRKIINVTSASGLIGAVGQSNYGAAKMGVVGLTKTLAKELGPLGIRVNAIAPAALTSMTEPLMKDAEMARRRLARFPLGRYGTPEEIAHAFVFMASSESDYITGQVLCVDGGLVI